MANAKQSSIMFHLPDSIKKKMQRLIRKSETYTSMTAYIKDAILEKMGREG